LERLLAASSVTSLAMRLKVLQSAARSARVPARFTATPKTRTNTDSTVSKPSHKTARSEPCGFLFFRCDAEMLCHSEISDYHHLRKAIAFRLASFLPALFPVYFDERLQEAHSHLIDPCQPPKSVSAGHYI
jgi:hypothetical protein